MLGAVHSYSTLYLKETAPFMAYYEGQHNLLVTIPPYYTSLLHMYPCIGEGSIHFYVFGLYTLFRMSVTTFLPSWCSSFQWIFIKSGMYNGYDLTKSCLSISLHRSTTCDNLHSSVVMTKSAAMRSKMGFCNTEWIDTP